MRIRLGVRPFSANMSSFPNGRRAPGSVFPQWTLASAIRHLLASFTKHSEFKLYSQIATFAIAFSNLSCCKKRIYIYTHDLEGILLSGQLRVPRKHLSQNNKTCANVRTKNPEGRSRGRRVLWETLPCFYSHLRTRVLLVPAPAPNLLHAASSSVSSGPWLVFDKLVLTNTPNMGTVRLP